jgi:HlyD family secretion protein
MIGPNNSKAFVPIGLLAAACLAAGCNQTESNRVQGYVEGEYVYVAAPNAGALKSLKVSRGASVQAGNPLFTLDDEPERAARDEAVRRVAQALANLEDAKKGRRPTEIESLEAQLKQARAALKLSEAQLKRQEQLAGTLATAAEDLNRAQATRDQDLNRVAQLEADLQTARLGSRYDQIIAAEANLRALESTLAKAEWDLAQKSQLAPRTGLVFDTLYYEGEWVTAGRPVVALLPPENIKVRAFVPEARVATIQVGDQARVYIDGIADPAVGKVSFVSPRAEFTPPVIYSRESRSKLVFLVEVRFDPKIAASLHPGQPVDIEFDQ